MLKGNSASSNIKIIVNNGDGMGLPEHLWRMNEWFWKNSGWHETICFINVKKKKEWCTKIIALLKFLGFNIKILGTQLSGFIRRPRGEIYVDPTTLSQDWNFLSWNKVTSQSQKFRGVFLKCPPMQGNFFAYCNFI